MKTTRLVVLAVLASLVSSISDFAYAGPINLLSNPSFEDDLSAWSVSVGTAIYVADRLVAQDGLTSARGEEISQGSLGRLYQDVTSVVELGESYVISGWIRTNVVSIDGGGVVLGLNFVDGIGLTPANGFVKEIGAVSGTTDWAFYESDPFSLPSQMPTGTNAVWFLTDFNASTGTAWVDDLALRKMSVPEPGTLGLLGIAFAGLTAARRIRATGG